MSYSISFSFECLVFSKKPRAKSVICYKLLVIRFKFKIHQTIKPSNHQTIKPSNHQTIKPSNHQTIKPSNHQTIKPSNHQTIKSLSH
jgi:hypothetical protein